MTYHSALETQIGFNHEEIECSILRRIIERKASSEEIAAFHGTLYEAFDGFLPFWRLCNADMALGLKPPCRLSATLWKIWR
jgi:hypothetical protein